MDKDTYYYIEHICKVWEPGTNYLKWQQLSDNKQAYRKNATIDIWDRMKNTRTLYGLIVSAMVSIVYNEMDIVYVPGKCFERVFYRALIASDVYLNDTSLFSFR